MKEKSCPDFFVEKSRVYQRFLKFILQLKGIPFIIFFERNQRKKCKIFIFFSHSKYKNHHSKYPPQFPFPE